MVKKQGAAQQADQAAFWTQVEGQVEHNPEAYEAEEGAEDVEEEEEEEEEVPPPKVTAEKKAASKKSSQDVQEELAAQMAKQRGGYTQRSALGDDRPWNAKDEAQERLSERDLADEKERSRKMGEQLDNYPFRLVKTWYGEGQGLSENRVEFENRKLYDAMMRATNARMQGHFSYPGEEPYAPINVDQVGKKEMSRANRKFPAIRQRMNKEELDYDQ